MPTTNVEFACQTWKPGTLLPIELPVGRPEAPDAMLVYLVTVPEGTKPGDQQVPVKASSLGATSIRMVLPAHAQPGMRIPVKAVRFLPRST